MNDSDPEVLEADEARAGRKTRHMPLILGLSTVAAAVIVFAVFAGFAA